ncbi:MAG: YceI family protein [Bacteroidetes bacterium]|nr:MAG: YceI family protein [Bacteroidota bacterium]
MFSFSFPSFLKLTLISAAFLPFSLAAQSVFTCDQGQLTLISEAPLETIRATSTQVKGLIDPVKRSFAFSVNIVTFQGFNSPLQREHFNENYLESDKYPKATFNGKIIETVDLTQNGVYIVRAKGMMNIHGVEMERIIKAEVEVKGGQMTVKADFTVLLTEHNITIPKIVKQKISEEVKVSINAVFSKST